MLKVVLTIGMLMTLPAAAQQETFTEQSKCWAGSMSFSPGATFRAGNAVMVCTKEFQWEATDQWSSGCAADGKFYTPGAVNNGPNASSIKTRCLEDGRWEVVAAE